jgi:hypothetical protein
MPLVSYVPFPFHVEFPKTKVTTPCIFGRSVVIIIHVLLLSHNYFSHIEDCAFLHGTTSEQDSVLFLGTLLLCAAEQLQ